MPKPENVAGKEWKPGQSGNPSGRPKGALNRSTLVRRWIESAGEVDGLSIADELVLAQIKQAKMGRTEAFKELMDSGLGKLVEKQELAVTAIPDNRSSLIDRFVNRRAK